MASKGRVCYIRGMSFLTPAKFLFCAAVLLSGGWAAAAEGVSTSSPATGTNASEDAKAKFYAIRRQAVMQLDGDFFKAAKFTPEQEEKFIAVRIEAEDRVLAQVHESQGTVPFMPSILARELDTAFAKAFSQDLARQYREFVNTRLGREFVQGSDELQADDWLTPEEQEKLAQAWGPIVCEAMDRSYDKKFETAPKNEKMAYYDRMMKECAAAAAGILSPAKQAKLKKCFQAMREKTLAELDKPKTGE